MIPAGATRDRQMASMHEDPSYNRPFLQSALQALRNLEASLATSAESDREIGVRRVDSEPAQPEQVQRFVLRLLHGDSLENAGATSCLRIESAKRECSARLASIDPLEVVLSGSVAVVCDLWGQRIVLTKQHADEKRTAEIFQEEDPLKEGSAWIQDVESVIAKEEHQQHNWRQSWEEALRFCRDPQEIPPFFSQDYQIRKQEIGQIVQRLAAVWKSVKRHRAEAHRRGEVALLQDSQVLEPAILLREFLEMRRYCKRRWTNEIEAVELRLLRIFPAAAADLGFRRPPAFFLPLAQARQEREQTLKGQSSEKLVRASGVSQQGLSGQDSHLQEVIMACYASALLIEVDEAVARERYARLSQQEKSLANAVQEHWNPHQMFWELLEAPESLQSLITAVKRDFDQLPFAEQEKIFGHFLQRYQEAVTNDPQLGFRHPRLDELESLRSKLEEVAAVPEEITGEQVHQAICGLIQMGLGGRFPASIDRIAAVLTQAIDLCDEDLPDHTVQDTPKGFFRSHLVRMRSELQRSVQQGMRSEEQKLDLVLNQLAVLQRRAQDERIAEPDSLVSCLQTLTDPNAIEQHHALLLAGVQATLQDWSKLRAGVLATLLQEALLLGTEDGEDGASGLRLSETGAQFWLVLTGVLEFVVERGQRPLLAWTQEQASHCISAAAPDLAPALLLCGQFVQDRQQSINRQIRSGIDPRQLLRNCSTIGRDATLAQQLLPRCPALYHMLDFRVRDLRSICLAAVTADPGLMAAVPSRWRRNPEFVADALGGCNQMEESIRTLCSHCLFEDMVSEDFVMNVLSTIHDRLVRFGCDPSGPGFSAFDGFCAAMPASIRDSERLGSHIVRLRPQSLARMSASVQCRACEPVLDRVDIRNFPDAVRDDLNAVRQATRQFPNAIAFASSRLVRDEQLMLELAQSNGESVLAVGDLWRGHEDILLAAVRSCPQAAALASPDLLSNRDWVCRVIDCNPQSILFLPLDCILPQGGDELDERGPAFRAIERDGLLIREIPDHFRSPSLIRLALQQNGRALAYLDEEGRGNEEWVRIAMEQNPLALVYAAPELRARQDLSDLLLERAAGSDEAWLIAANDASRQNPEARARWDRARDRETLWESWDEFCRLSLDDPEREETWRAILSADGLAFARAPAWARSRADLAFSAVWENPRALLAIGPELMRNRDFLFKVQEIFLEDNDDPFDPLFAAWLAWLEGEAEAARWIRAFPNAYPLLPRTMREAPNVLGEAVQSASNFALLPVAYRNTPEAIARSWEDRIEHQLRFAPLFCRERRESLLQDLPCTNFPLEALPYAMRKDREAIRELARCILTDPSQRVGLSNGIGLLRTMDEALRFDAQFILEMVQLNPSWLHAAEDVLFQDEAFVRKILCIEVKQGAPLVESHRKRPALSGKFWHRFLRDPDAIAQLGDRIETAFALASIEIRRSPEAVRSLALEHPRILPWADSYLRGDRQFCLDLVSERAECWFGMDPNMITEEFAFQALLRNGRILQYLSPEWRHRDELVAAAVSSEPTAIQWAGQDLREGERLEKIQRRATLLRASLKGKSQSQLAD